MISSALPIKAEVEFSVRSNSKVINRKQNGHIAPHGLYVRRTLLDFSARGIVTIVPEVERLNLLDLS